MKIMFLYNPIGLAPHFALIEEELGKEFEVVNVYHTCYTKDYIHNKLKLKCLNYYIYTKDYYKRRKTGSLPKEDLKKWESKLNFPLLKILHADLQRWSYHDYRKDYEEILLSYILFFDEIFNKENIAYIIHERVSDAFTLSAYLIGKLYNADYRGFEIAKFPGRLDVLDDLYGYNQTRVNLFLRNEPVFLNVECRDYLLNLAEKKPDYVLGQDRLPVILSIDMFKKALVYVLADIKSIKYDKLYPAIGGGSRFLNGLFFTKKKIGMIANWYNAKWRHFFKYPHTEEQYFLFPLQYQPEASTLILAPHFSNQYEVIRNISMLLPVGIKLYVKEHRAFIGTRGSNFYRKILAFPNVELIHPFADTIELIKKSMGIITITSTVGYEALLVNKPVICFGNVFYDFHPLCIKCTDYLKLPNYITNIVNGLLKFDPSWQDRFLYAYYNTTFPGFLSKQNPNSLLKENIKNISNTLRATF